MTYSNAAADLLRRRVCNSSQQGRARATPVDGLSWLSSGTAAWNGTLDISSLLRLVAQAIARGIEAPESVQQLLVMFHALDDARSRALSPGCGADPGVFVTDAQVDAITALVPTSAEDPKAVSSLANWLQLSSAIALLRITAENPANAASLLAPRGNLHPLLALQAHIKAASASGEACSYSTLKQILLFLISFESALAHFSTEELQNQALQHDWSQSYSLAHHAALAYNAVRTHVFKDATGKNLSHSDLEMVFELTDEELLAKVDGLLQDMVEPLLWYDDAEDAGSVAMQSFTVDSPNGFDTVENGLATHADLQSSAEHLHAPKFVVTGFPCIRHLPRAQHPIQNKHKTLGSEHLRRFGSAGIHASHKVRTPKTAIAAQGITDRRFEGAVLCFNPEKNFGYITCSELRPRFNKDVWVHKEQLGHFEIGQLVSFMVIINKQGHPQAVSLLPVSKEQHHFDDVFAGQPEQFMILSL